MDRKLQITALLQAAAAKAKQILGDRLCAVVLYGSYARGDFDAQSDVDILIKIDCDRQMLSSYEHAFACLSSRLSLQYDVTVSIVTVSLQTFDQFKQVLPFYQNVEREGICVA